VSSQRRETSFNHFFPFSHLGIRKSKKKKKQGKIGAGMDESLQKWDCDDEFEIRGAEN
jgi:hypothetical protein